jgi:hypothetical protein
MAYEYDGDAVAEAQQYLLQGDKLKQLRSLIDEKLESLGSAGVRGHRVAYDVEAWSGLVPTRLSRDCEGSISRGEVFDLAAEGDLLVTLAASFLWGSGNRGYGPHRYKEIVKGASDRLAEMLSAAFEASTQDVVHGYEMLFGGRDQKGRTKPLTAPWARIADFGPAFFTKFLYFTNPEGLILDNVLANAVAKLSHMPHLVNAKQRSPAWSPYRYAVYLHWMRRTSDELRCTADELELTLFAPPGPLPE